MKSNFRDSKGVRKTRDLASATDPLGEILPRKYGMKF